MLNSTTKIFALRIRNVLIIRFVWRIDVHVNLASFLQEEFVVNTESNHPSNNINI